MTYHEFPKPLPYPKRMNKIVKQNVIFSITVIMILISSNFLQAVDLPLGVIGHEGSTIFSYFKQLKIIKISKAKTNHKIRDSKAPNFFD